MKTPLSKEQILSILSREKTSMHDQFGVISIGLFGSFARECQTEDSDIDLLVELKTPRFDWMAGLQIYLEEKLGHRIEIIRKGKHLNHRFQKVIENDILYV